MLSPAGEEPQIHLDAGWYRTTLRIDLLAPDWDHVRCSHSTADLDEFVTTLESWLYSIPE